MHDVFWLLFARSSGRRQEQSILNVTFVYKHQINVLETADSQTFKLINVAKTSTMIECHSVSLQGTPGLHENLENYELL